MPKEKIDSLPEEMRAGGHDRLVIAHDSNFGEFVNPTLPDEYELRTERKPNTESKKKSRL